RLLRRRRVDPGADPPPLRSREALLATLAGLQAGGRDLALGLDATLADELVDAGHASGDASSGPSSDWGARDPLLPRSLVHQLRPSRDRSGPQGPRRRVGLDRLLGPQRDRARLRPAAGPGGRLRRRGRVRFDPDPATAGAAPPGSTAVPARSGPASRALHLPGVVQRALEAAAQRDRGRAGPPRDGCREDRAAVGADGPLARPLRSDARRAEFP